MNLTLGVSISALCQALGDIGDTAQAEFTGEWEAVPFRAETFFDTHMGTRNIRFDGDYDQASDAADPFMQRSTAHDGLMRVRVDETTVRPADFSETSARRRNEYSMSDSRVPWAMLATDAGYVDPTTIDHTYHMRFTFVPINLDFAGDWCVIHQGFNNSDLGYGAAYGIDIRPDGSMQIFQGSVDEAAFLAGGTGWSKDLLITIPASDVPAMLTQSDWGVEYKLGRTDGYIEFTHQGQVVVSTRDQNKGFFYRAGEYSSEAAVANVNSKWGLYIETFGGEVNGTQEAIFYLDGELASVGYGPLPAYVQAVVPEFDGLEMAPTLGATSVSVSIPAQTTHASDLSGFAAPVNLDGVDFGADVTRDGDNLQAFDASGVRVPLHVPYFDSSTQKGMAYIKIDTSVSSASEYTIRPVVGAVKADRTGAYGEHAVFAEYDDVFGATFGFSCSAGNGFWERYQTTEVERIAQLEERYITGEVGAHQGVAYDETADLIVVIDNNRLISYSGSEMASGAVPTPVDTNEDPNGQIDAAFPSITLPFIHMGGGEIDTETGYLWVINFTLNGTIQNTCVAAFDTRSPGLPLVSAFEITANEWADDAQTVRLWSSGGATIVTTDTGKQVWTCPHNNGTGFFKYAIDGTASAPTISLIERTDWVDQSGASVAPGLIEDFTYAWGKLWLSHENEDQLLVVETDGTVWTQGGAKPNVGVTWRGPLDEARKYEGVCRFKEGFMALRSNNEGTGALQYWTPRPQDGLYLVSNYGDNNDDHPKKVNSGDVIANNRGDFTATTYIVPDSNRNEHALLTGSYSTGSYQRSLHLGAAGSINQFDDANSWGVGTAIGLVSATTVNQVGFTYEGAQCRIHHDGSDVSTESITATSGTSLGVQMGQAADSTSSEFIGTMGYTYWTSPKSEDWHDFCNKCVSGTAITLGM